MHKKIFITFGLCILMASSPSLAQDKVGLAQILTADSMSSFNFKNVLTSFFKLDLQNLTDSNKSVSFNANLFAVMLKNNPNLDIDTNYKKYRAARNTNVSAAANITSGSKFNGATLGLKYAIINERDITTEKFIAVAKHALSNYGALHKAIVKKIIKSVPDFNDPRRISYNEQLNNFFAYDTVAFKDLDVNFQAIVMECLEDLNYTEMSSSFKTDPSLSMANLRGKVFDSVKNSFQNKPLWTVAVNGQTYSDKFQFSNINFTSEFLKGVCNPHASSNLELDIKCNLAMSNDSNSLIRNLNRSVFSAEAGVNWVIKGLATNGSNVEFKMAVADNSVLSGAYAGETKQNFTLNGTLAIRISQNISVPIQFKYDPSNGNVFGFLSVTSNFSWMNGAH